MIDVFICSKTENNANQTDVFKQPCVFIDIYKC